MVKKKTEQKKVSFTIEIDLRNVRKKSVKSVVPHHRLLIENKYLKIYSTIIRYVQNLSFGAENLRRESRN